MVFIQYPEPGFRTRKEGEKTFIFDQLRKKWLLLSAEEWVRQNFVNYLISGLQYPATLIALEKTLLLNNLKKRFDILVYDHTHCPWMMVECKAPAVPLSEPVLQQLLRYHISIPVPLLVITNGTQTMGWQKEGRHLQLLQHLPAWPFRQ